jgi:lipid-binding SYLF domain-containing protein
MKTLKLLLSLLLAIFMLSGFWSGKSDKEIKAENNEARKERQKTNSETLKKLYKYAPKAKGMITRSYGYATFTNVGVNLIILSAEGGKGMAQNNKTGKKIYMNMGSGGVGFGLGVKDFRAIFLFENKKVFDSFVNSGWEANAQADAAAKAGEDGGAINAAVTVAPGIRLYKLTENGLAIQATIQGTKYWKDGDLN